MDSGRAAYVDALVVSGNHHATYDFGFPQEPAGEMTEPPRDVMSSIARDGNAIMEDLRAGRMQRSLLKWKEIGLFSLVTMVGALVVILLVRPAFAYTKDENGVVSLSPQRVFALALGAGLTCTAASWYATT